MIENIEDFFNEEPPRNSLLVDEIILKAKHKYLILHVFSIFISLFCAGMVGYIEYPDLQNATYFFFFCVVLFVMPAYLFKRLIIARVRNISTHGQFLKGTVVTSNKLRGWNIVGIEPKLPELKRSIFKFSLIPMEPIMIVGEKVPMIYHPEYRSIIIGYFNKCGLEIGHIDRINFLIWFFFIGAAIAIVGILLWYLF